MEKPVLVHFTVNFLVDSTFQITRLQVQPEHYETASFDETIFKFSICFNKIRHLQHTLVLNLLCYCHNMKTLGHNCNMSYLQSSEIGSEKLYGGRR